jgi:hypothetical protein
VVTISHAVAAPAAQTPMAINTGSGRQITDKRTPRMENNDGGKSTPNAVVGFIGSPPGKMRKAGPKGDSLGRREYWALFEIP